MSRIDFAYEFHDMKHGWNCPKNCTLIDIIKLVDCNREFDEFIIKKLGGEIKSGIH